MVIPVYNQERYLGAAIDSVLAQSFRDFELIVVDDGSTDRTPDVMARFGPQIRPVHKPNGGNASALNAGIREAGGRWIGWLSSDDLWEPTKLERQLEALRVHPEAALAYTDVLVIDGEDHVLYRRSYPSPQTARARLRLLLRTCYINGSTVLVRRDVLDRVGPFDERDRLASDHDMWLRIAERFDVLHVPEALVRYRVHGAQLSKKGALMERGGKRAAMRSVRRVGAGLGLEVLLLRLWDELSSIPWMSRGSGGGYGLRERAQALLETFRIFVDPFTY